MKLDFDDRSPRSIQQRIVEEVEERIARGEMGFGDRLPSCESLAKENGVHRLTVLAAYRELARKGRVHSSPRRGTLVCQTSMSVRDELFRGLLQGLLEKGKLLGMTPREIEAELALAQNIATIEESPRPYAPMWDLYAPTSSLN